MIQPASERVLDGVKLAILNNRLEGIARKMANTLMRTGRSGVLNSARDFSCCILTADSELLVANEALPIHTLSGPDMMARVMKEFHPDLKRGDAFLNNSPYHGGSHAADHTLLVPVMDDQGRHRLTVSCKAHQADIGNSIPTTYHGTAKDVYEEGALIFPSIKVQDNYEINADIVRMCRMRIRVPDQWWGDFLAMVGSARIGEKELQSIAGEVGWDTLESFSRDWFNHSERRMIAALRAMPAGAAQRSSCHDAIPGTPPAGIVINVKVAIDPANALVSVDLRDNIDCLPCGLNLSEACARTAAMVGVFNSINHAVPKNAGSFRRIEVKLRENCVVGIPRHPTSTSVATTNLADRVANGVQSAIADMAEGHGLAECGALLPPAAGVISGIDPRSGGPFVNQIFLGLTGGAASASADAWLTICHVGNAGMCNQDSIELDELRQPIHVYARSLVPDTEGAGKFCGAQSCAVEFGPIGCEISVGYVSDGMDNPPKGARGGMVGGAANQYLLGKDAVKEPLPACAQVTLKDGQRLLSVSCGGGGYGSPRDRSPEAVLHDLAEGRITPGRAARVYGVVTGADGKLDRAATARLRAD